MQRSLDAPASESQRAPVDLTARRLDELERRVAALESLRQPAASIPAQPLQPELPSVPKGIAPILGRALLGLAGAYMLRAAAESDVAPRHIVVIAALAYAAVWLASSTISRGTLAPLVHTITASLILAPLLWENTVTIPVIPSAVSALILVAFVIAGLVIEGRALSWRGHAPVIFRITLLSAAGTALALLMATHDLAAFTIGLLAMAAVAEGAACTGRSLGERWIPAVSVDVSLLVLTFVYTRPNGVPEGYPPMPALLLTAIQGGALAVYFGGTAYRTLVRGMRIHWYEVLQGSAIFAVAITGVLLISQGPGRSSIGGLCLIVAAVAYAAAFAPGRIVAENRNVRVYALWGLSSALSGSLLLFTGIGLAAALGAFAVAAAYFATRRQPVILRIHACVYITVAAAASGLLRYCYFVSIEPAESLAAIPASAIVAASCLLICYLLASGTATLSTGITSAVLGVTLSWSVASTCSGAIAMTGMSLTGLPTVRTLLLCVLAMMMVYAGRRFARPELLWLQYAVLVFGAIKLLFEDFPAGNPAALALSLLLYGATLILLPRLRAA